jgi:hypothetical protein
VVEQSKAFNDVVISRRACKSSCCVGLKRDAFGKAASAKASGARMRNTSALLRDLPPHSIHGVSTAVPRRLPINQLLRIFNGSAARADAGCGLLFSSVAHIPFIDELPSAWTGLRRDVNASNFVMWDQGGTDTLFSLWKDGQSAPHAHAPAAQRAREF